MSYDPNGPNGINTQIDQYREQQRRQEKEWEEKRRQHWEREQARLNAHRSGSQAKNDSRYWFGF